MNVSSKLLFLIIIFFSLFCKDQKQLELLNVSYDPTREFYQEYNSNFIQYYKQKTSQDVKIRQSHGGSGKQARAIIDGLKADVVTLALAYDVDAISDKKLIDTNWQSRLSNKSAPYTSTIVFVVKKGNPKNIKDWNDLIRDDVSVITPNPKTSGGARWNYLAAWGYSYLKDKDENYAKEFVTKLYKNVRVLDTGSRSASISFTNKKLGDVLISWENEAFFTVKETNGEVEIITPSISILTEPPVSIVDKNVNKKNTRTLALEYLKYLYSDEAQEIAARHYYRPSRPEILKKHEDKFKTLILFTVDELGGWRELHKKHFIDGGVFDSIYGVK